ncbi:MAG: hybrid sensor histidine kinase/response regulator, partial [Burkholderiales bacterium]|nr:hybrid sensor histidine kinase/response regulator [Burkholderiales bacterium]
ALINDLLDLSRIESGRMDVAREAFDFVEVVAEASGQLRPLAQQKGLALRLELPPRLAMLGDRRKVYQVLLNLLGNALKFTAQGKVTVRADSVGEQLQVEVIDTGIGIAPRDIDALFEAFRQVDGSLIRDHDGAGLGLHLCRKLLHLMGGTINVRSTPGEGSCFSFALPLQLPGAVQTAAS